MILTIISGCRISHLRQDPCSLTIAQSARPLFEIDHVHVPLRLQLPHISQPHINLHLAGKQITKKQNNYMYVWFVEAGPHSFVNDHSN